MKKKPKIVIISTGGTIGAKMVKGKWKYGELSGEDLLDVAPNIRKEFDFKTSTVFRMDSTDMRPEHWLTLANSIYHNMKSFDGIVVTMGTDTMSYAASAISFIIQKPNIPIVFTGAQIDASQLNTDAKRNLREAVTVATQSDIAETLIVFNGSIIRGTRSKKVSASNFQGFNSVDVTPLGNIEHYIKFNGPYRKRSNSKPVFYNKLETDVAILKVYPGFETERISNIIDQGNLKGLVIEGYGLGLIPTANDSARDAIKYANKKNVPIVITSDCSLGDHWEEIYDAEIGNRRDGVKVIPVFDMPTDTAYVKLMWVLAQTTKFSEIKKLMQKNYVGEITEHKKPRKI